MFETVGHRSSFVDQQSNAVTLLRIVFKFQPRMASATTTTSLGVNRLNLIRQLIFSM